MSERIKEEIAFYKEVLKLLAMALLADIGGIAGLLYKLDKPVTMLLIGAGIWFALCLSVGVIITVSKIQELLRRLG